MNSIKDIPQEFTVCNHFHRVVFVDKIDTNSYGNYCAASGVITLAREVSGVKLTEEQILNTFEHELLHVFQFFYNNDYDETQAQVYANYRREFEVSKR